MATMQASADGFWGEPIHVYSRAQAIEDGELVDVSALAKEYGIRYPVAFTRSLWGQYVTPPAAVAGWQDETGRAWDVLTMLRLAAVATNGPETRFSVLFQMVPGRRPKLVPLKALCGPGDDAEPVITVMLPDED